MKLSTFIPTLALACTASAVTINPRGASASPSIKNVYTFPKNHFIEAISVRPNSRLLVTSMSVPDLFEIDPLASTPTATSVHAFTDSSGLMGIAEVSNDVYAVVGGVWDLANTRAELGSLQVWTVDFTKTPRRVKYVTTIANSTIFNGLVRHPTNPRLLLAADSGIGAVWKVDLVTGEYGIAFQDPLLSPTGTAPGTNLGINGLKAHRQYLYFTNSAQKFYGRVKISSSGAKIGAIEKLAESADAGADVIYDDIALEVKNGVVKSAWIASHPTYAVKIGRDGSQVLVNNTVRLLNPTAAAFGRGQGKQKSTLYVTLGGWFEGMDLVKGGVVAVDLSRK